MSYLLSEGLADSKDTLHCCCMLRHHAAVVPLSRKIEWLWFCTF